MTRAREILRAYLAQHDLVIECEAERKHVLALIDLALRLGASDQKNGWNDPAHVRRARGDVP